MNRSEKVVVVFEYSKSFEEGKEIGYSEDLRPIQEFHEVNWNSLGVSGYLLSIFQQVSRLSQGKPRTSTISKNTSWL